MFFLILGPSGVGKGTIIQALKKKFASDPSVVFPITATTRTPRAGEIHGKDYIFMEKKEFEHHLTNDFFLEHAMVHGKEYYGLPKKEVLDALNNKKSIIRELDIQGLWNLQKKIPKEQLVSIFIKPPSLEALQLRIQHRSPLPPEEIMRRLQSAQFEIDHMHECNAIICSEQGDIEGSIENVLRIIQQYS